MQKIINRLFLFGAIMTGISACIDPFNPPEINNPTPHLVYDGFINTNGIDTSWVRLSRTQNIHDLSGPTLEPGASITVEGENGTSYPLSPDSRRPGSYFLPPSTFDLAQQYRVSIVLNGNSYQSEWQLFRVSPPIDSVSYKVINDKEGVQIYVHTHDPTNQSRFYKWTFEETWEYFSPLYSSLEVVDSQIVDRVVNINSCWSSLNATNINLFTSAALSQDLVRSHPITYVAAGSGKLMRAYSIKVNQQVLSREAYDYWVELSKNNETNGSIFDPFPSQLTGNISSLDHPDEKVFGFFGGGVVESERIFVREYLGIYPQCYQIDTLSRKDVLESTSLISRELPELPGNYITAPAICLDCRELGGTIIRPSFWR